MSKKSNNISAQIQDIRNFIRVSHESIKDGNMVDITRIEHDMEDLAEHLLSAPKDIIEENHSVMSALMDEIEALSNTLEDLYRDHDKIH